MLADATVTSSHMGDSVLPLWPWVDAWVHEAAPACPQPCCLQRKPRPQLCTQQPRLWPVAYANFGPSNHTTLRVHVRGGHGRPHAQRWSCRYTHTPQARHFSHLTPTSRCRHAGHQLPGLPARLCGVLPAASHRHRLQPEHAICLGCGGGWLCATGLRSLSARVVPLACIGVPCLPFCRAVRRFLAAWPCPDIWLASAYDHAEYLLAGENVLDF